MVALYLRLLPTGGQRRPAFHRPRMKRASGSPALGRTADSHTRAFESPEPVAAFTLAGMESSIHLGATIGVSS
jgi:hypothetical protein